ncbi:hypothetical protein GCM10028861_00140 [Flavobacterium koreense]
MKTLQKENQLELFQFPKCSVCGKEMGSHPKNIHLANGFFDHDTKENVHWSCRDTHYQNKQKKGLGGLYSEFPLMINL